MPLLVWIVCAVIAMIIIGYLLICVSADIVRYENLRFRPATPSTKSELFWHTIEFLVVLTVVLPILLFAFTLWDCPDGVRRYFKYGPLHNKHYAQTMFRFVRRKEAQAELQMPVTI